MLTQTSHSPCQQVEQALDDGVISPVPCSNAPPPPPPPPFPEKNMLLFNDGVIWRGRERKTVRDRDKERESGYGKGKSTIIVAIVLAI